MNRICIAALMAVMICASGCGPSEREVEARREAEVAKEEAKEAKGEAEKTKLEAEKAKLEADEAKLETAQADKLHTASSRKTRRCRVSDWWAILDSNQ